MPRSVIESAQFIRKGTELPDGVTTTGKIELDELAIIRTRKR